MNMQDMRATLVTKTGLGLALLCLMALTACTSTIRPKMVVGPGYEPSNVYRQSTALAPTLRRVAVLPLAVDESRIEPMEATQALEPALRTELLKTRKFELVWVAPESLRKWTGKQSWTAEDKLPADFFANLREQTGCDAVLFCRVSRFHAYPPLVVGWNFKLIGAGDSQPVWAIDETFDASEPDVANSARRYENSHRSEIPPADSPLILNSPRRFGHYTAWAALGTLPTR